MTSSASSAAPLGVRRPVLALTALLWAGLSALALAAVRPANPQVVAALASPVGEVRRAGEVSEGQAFIASLSPDLQQRLAAERRLLLPEDRGTDGSMAGYIKAVALFAQPKERVFALMTDPSKQALYLPRLEKAVAVKNDGTGELTEFHIEAGLLTVTFRTQHWWWPAYTRMEWALDPSYDNDVKVAAGFWQIYGIDDHTSVGEYGTIVDTGLPVPDALQGYLTRKDMPAALEGMQRYIDSGGAWRRPE